MLTIHEIISLSDQELRAELAKSERELLRLKLAVKMGQEKATHKVTLMKKYVAQLMTVKRYYELEKLEKQEPIKS